METSVGAANAGRLLILIEDDPSFAEEVAAFFGQEYRIVWLDRSERALEAVLCQRPHLVLLDLNLPHHFSVLDEDEGLGLLKRLPGAVRAKVVVVTAALSAPMRARLGRLGVDRIHLKSEPLMSLWNLLADGEARDVEGQMRAGGAGRAGDMRGKPLSPPQDHGTGPPT
jgi:DNA-binding NarL/FixJ family response regulator